ncbi:hypothetical protein [Burkholderia cenocepacia]|uniref:hypothetical protein n=1 Tax=Burkholderia cenocepacia TaxID=95486 RepID=UPI000D0C4EFB|nr:hypothetical protein [Burkholderia cenocepacia]SOT45110.1 conserved hypothetical protein [Burkholderia cenocepacia]
MDTARCNADGRVYTAPEFEALPANEIVDKRRSLVCVECNGPGFFRRKSRSGQAACFGARPHAPSCTTPDTESRTLKGTPEDHEPFVNLGDHVEVDLSFGSRQVHVVPPRDGDERPTPEDARRGRRFTGTTGRTAVSRRRPSSLLRMLVESENFRNSGTTIAIPNHIQGTPREVFVEFSEIEQDALVGQYRGYWGFVAEGKMDANDALWLNSGGTGDVSVLVPPDLVGVLFERYGATDAEDFTGAYVLVFGYLRLSKRNKQFVRVEDVDTCVLYEPSVH